MSAAGAEDVSRLRNVRDVGGLPLVGGGTTRHGVLLRSDAPRAGDAVPDDLAWPPRSVVDLRSPGEAADPHPLSGDAEVHVVPLSAEASIDGLALVASAGLGALYASILETAGERVGRVVSLVAAGPAPTLVHCTAGKDRTGLVVAIALAALGVEREAVVADFARTQANMDGVIARIASTPREHGRHDWGTFLQTVDPAVLSAPAEAIRSVLATVDAAGGPEHWLTHHGVPAEALERLRRRLTG